jgi:hypothetical protein
MHGATHPPLRTSRPTRIEEKKGKSEVRRWCLFIYVCVSYRYCVYLHIYIYIYNMYIKICSNKREKGEIRGERAFSMNIA